MSIISIQTVQAGLVGVLPSVAYINTSDTLAEVTATGYLNKEVANGTQFSLPCIAAVATQSSPTAAQVVSWFQISHVGANWSLVAPSSDSLLLPNGDIFVGNASGIAAAVAMSGDATLSNTGALTIASGAITNAKISASAAIAFSKLAALTSGNILVGNGSNVATSVAMSGDATLSNAGVLTIANNAINNAKISTSAAIAFSKLAALNSGNILVGSAGNVATSVTMSGAATISNTGVLTLGNNVVALANLAAGITPASIVKYAGTSNYAGGAASTTITVTGMLATDLPFVQIQASTNAVTVEKVTPTSDTITILMSGDPGASTIFSYQVLRAAS